MTRTFDWLGRTAIIALSLFATLSIIGSIAAIPSGSIESRLGMSEAQPPEATSAPIEGTTAPPAGTEAQSREAGTAQGAAATASPPGQPRDPLESWLESITYALIAIAALLAAGVFLLWRALHQWRRLADAAAWRG